MILAKTSDNGIFDLNTGTLYSKGDNKLEVYFRGKRTMVVMGKYAESLWTYLNIHLVVSPK